MSAATKLAGLFALALAGLGMTGQTPALCEDISAPLVQITITTPPQTVYEWRRQKCDALMIPDAPARAFRNRVGTVRLIAASNTNWSMAGSSLNDLAVDCHPLILGRQSADPAEFDDMGWIEAVFTTDGQIVTALLSDEWNAFRHPGTTLAEASGCHDPHHENCFFYAITQAVSADGGEHFALNKPFHVAVALPDRFAGRPETNMAEGFATVSNIVRRGRFFYMFAGSRGGGAQAVGNCLLRSEDVADPAAWRGWDGHGFTVSFHNPYRPVPAESAGQVCQPIPVPAGGMEEVRSLSWHPASRSFIAVVRGVFRPEGSAQKQAGFFYSTSRDLLRWSRPALLMPIALQRDCAPLLFYPSMIDPDSKSPNFDEVGALACLYYSRFNITKSSCKGTMDRDLVQSRLAIQPR